MLALVASGAIYETEKFRDTPPHLRRLNDIAFSGDGEPTTYRNFDEIIAACAELKRRHGLDDVKMVLITNASMFHRPHVAARPGDPRRRTTAKSGPSSKPAPPSITSSSIARRFRSARFSTTSPPPPAVRPLVIQALFMRVHGEPPPPAELEAFCDRLNEIIAAGGQIKLVQIYTIARRPTESYVTPLTDAEVDRLTALVRGKTGLPAAAYYGIGD